MAYPVSEKIHFTRTDSSATLEYVMGFQEALDYAAASIGGYKTVGGELQYVKPLQYDRISGLWCSSVDVEPLDQNSENGDWVSAKLTIVYTIPDQQSQDQNNSGKVDLGETSLDFACDAVSLGDGSKFKWDGGPKDGKALGAGDVQPYAFLGVVQVKQKVMGLPYLPVDTVASLAGKLNSSSFLGIAEERVLFSGATSSRKVTSEGAETWNVEYSFSIRPQSWNKILNTEDGNWYKLDTPLYESDDLNQLF